MSAVYFEAMCFKIFPHSKEDGFFIVDQENFALVVSCRLRHVVSISNNALAS
jgi:hypothetical protein